MTFPFPIMVPGVPPSVDQTAGQTFTSSDTFSGLSNTFDDNNGTEWLSGSNDTGWIQVQFASAKTFTGYSVTASSTSVTRTPHSWTVQGSNTGAFGGEEVTLDTQTTVAAWSASEKRTYTIGSPGSYLYMRFNYLAKLDALGKGNEYALTEMEMLGY